MLGITLSVKCSKTLGYKMAIANMIELAKKNDCFVETIFNDVHIKVRPKSDPTEIEFLYKQDLKYVNEERLKKLDSLTLKEVLKKMGGLKFPCYFPKLVSSSKGDARFIQYRVFRSWKNPCAIASINLVRLFPEYEKLY